MPVGDSYFDSRTEGGSITAACVINTTIQMEYVKIDDTLETIIKKTIDKVKQLDKRITELEP